MRKGTLQLFCVGIAVLLPLSARSESVRLVRPIDCKIGTTCFIQNLVDHEPGPGASDFQCGHLTYDGHNGTDFRVPDLISAKDMPVVAAADGVVRRLRDGMQDISIRDTGKDAVKGKECGNALVIGHGADWETQYCHLAKGSLMVKPGDSVVAGQAIAKVGLSGLTEFPHVHLTVRERGRIVDPFAYGQKQGQCDKGQSLWREPLSYRSGFLINLGFADRPLEPDAIDRGALLNFELHADAKILLAVARSGGLIQNDVIELALSGPDGAVLANKTSAPLKQHHAQQVIAIGKRRPIDGWPRGRYTINYKLIRNSIDWVERTVALMF